MTKKTTTRVQLELPQTSYSRLKALREKTEAGSYAEVMKNALRLYEEMVEEALAGNQLMIKDTTGKETTYKMLF